MTGELAAYDRLVAVLREGEAAFRILDHEPEGRTDLVSAMRGHPVEQAAKCLIVMVKLGKKETRYVLAVLPGDARVDIQAIKALLNGSYATFASREKAEELAGSPTGTVLPFSFSPELELIADPGLLDQDEIFFNAGRLDRSIALAVADYRRLATPRVERIVETAGSQHGGIRG